MRDPLYLSRRNLTVDFALARKNFLAMLVQPGKMPSQAEAASRGLLVNGKARLISRADPAASS